MSMRQKRHKEAQAAAGAPHGGRRRFGYTDAMDVIPAEAETVRELASRFLAGESLRSLAKWLNTSGVDTPGAESRRAKGKEPALWTGPNLRHMLGRPHLAGLRVHHGAVVGKGMWDAILPLETHESVVAMLAAPGRRPEGASNARVYLLAGLAVCDECGAKLRGRPRTGRNQAPAYLCPTGRHVHRPVEAVDAKVEDAMVAFLARHDVAGVLVDDVEAGELARLREAREALDDRYTDYVAQVANMTPRAYAAATAGLEAEMDQLDAAIREAAAVVKQASRVLEGATGETAAEAWAGFDLSRKRAVITELAEVRLIGGANGGRFNPDDVAVRWR